MNCGDTVVLAHSSATLAKPKLSKQDKFKPNKSSLGSVMEQVIFNSVALLDTNEQTDQLHLTIFKTRLFQTTIP